MARKCNYTLNSVTQRAPYDTITSLWHQNDVPTPFWCLNDVCNGPCGNQSWVAHSRVQHPNHWAIQVPERLSCLCLAHAITIAGLWGVIQVCSTPFAWSSAHNWNNTCVREGLACRLTLCILEQIICNFINSVQIAFIQTLELITFSWTIRLC